MWNQFQFKKLIQKHWLHDAKWSKTPTIKSGWSIKTPIKRSPVHCYFCTLHRMCPYYRYRYSIFLKFAPMIEGLLLEVVCKYEVKQTKIHDFMQVFQVLGFFGPPCIRTYEWFIRILEKDCQSKSTISVRYTNLEFSL